MRTQLFNMSKNDNVDDHRTTQEMVGQLVDAKNMTVEKLDEAIVQADRMTQLLRDIRQSLVQKRRDDAAKTP